LCSSMFQCMLRHISVAFTLRVCVLLHLCCM
jgi:hypothetical protein